MEDNSGAYHIVDNVGYQKSTPPHPSAHYYSTPQYETSPAQKASLNPIAMMQAIFSDTGWFVILL